MSHVIVVDDNRSDGFLTVKWEGRDAFSALRFEHTFRLTEEELGNVLQAQMLIQNAAPRLTADERELFITGMYPGSMGENCFDFTCFSCGKKHRVSIDAIGQDYKCDCGNLCQPFKISELM